jgi:1-deoxy-D-xylulose-5-phosphate reductoisomerase
MNRRIFILGSTGSIGTNTVNTILHLQEQDGAKSWPVVGLAAGSNSTLLREQAKELQVEAVSIQSDESIGVEHQYKNAVDLLRAHAKRGDLVVAAIVGFSGIAPVLAGIELGCTIALANKETLVAGGEVIMNAAKQSGVQILPIDSEHSAIFQALEGNCTKEVRKIVLTASGGALRGFSKEEVANATIEQVLNHPTWDMGSKVTVDSASLMNKSLELIEAHWLFGVSAEKLHAIIHPQSVVHGMVEYVDGSVIAQLSPPDMRLPIQYALTWPNRKECACETVNWSDFQNLTFTQIDTSVFPAIELAYEVMRLGGTAGAVLNATNEVVVEAFLAQKLSFGSMVGIVTDVLQNFPIQDRADFDAVVEADREARACAAQRIACHKVNS